MHWLLRPFMLLVAVAAWAVPPAVAASSPGGCKTVASISEPGYVVDQAWQIYRQLPAPWCSCAKVCEPIDRLAADYEAAALVAYRASRDIKFPAAERNRLFAQSSALFAERNADATRFRACQIAMKPPLKQSLTPLADPIQGCANVNVVLPLADRWKLWCDKWESGFKEVWDKYDQDPRLPNGDYVVKIKLVARSDGRLRTDGGSIPPGFPAAVALDLQKALLGIKVSPFPADSTLKTYPWTATFEFAQGVPRVIPNAPFPCPTK